MYRSHMNRLVNIFEINMFWNGSAPHEMCRVFVAQVQSWYFDTTKHLFNVLRALHNPHTSIFVLFHTSKTLENTKWIPLRLDIDTILLNSDLESIRCDFESNRFSCLLQSRVSTELWIEGKGKRAIFANSWMKKISVRKKVNS